MESITAVDARAWELAARSKISTVEALAASPDSFVLTKGVFDILHAGHLRLFACCRDLAVPLGAKTVVALTSDRLVRVSKGSMRPITPQDERLDQVSCIRDVDIVVLNDEPDMSKMVRALEPKIYVKGGDTTRALRGEELDSDLAAVVDNGGRAYIFTDDGRLSTSRTIRRILAKEGR